jgi:hypothetical protein
MELARTEGFPTTWKDFRASLPAVPNRDNAGLIYAQLKFPPHAETNRISQLGWDQLYAPTPESTKELKMLLQRHSVDLYLFDQATRKSRCLIHREWEKGLDLKRPELARVRAYAKMVLARSSLLARGGNHLEALNEVRKVYRAGNHFYQMPGTLEALLGTVLVTIAHRQLTELAFVFPAYRTYLTQLELYLQEKPRIDRYYQVRARSMEFLELMQVSHSAKQQVPNEAKHLKEGNMPPGSTAKNLDLAELVRGYRMFWTGIVALNQPESNVKSVQKIFDSARAQFDKAAGNKVLAEYFYPLVPKGKSEAFAIFRFRDRLLPEKAFMRAMNEPEIPRTLDLSDMKLETDGTPMRYQYDGKTMLIQGGSKEAKNFIELRLPTKRPSEN